MKPRRYQYSGVLLIYVENLLRLIYGVGVLFVARHLLNADAFANFAFYLSLATLCYGLSRFSFDAYVVKEFVLNPFRAIGVLWKIMLVRSLGSALVILVVIAFLCFFNKLDLLFSLIIIFQFFRVVDSVEWLLRAEGRLATQAVVRIISMVVVSVALIMLLSFANTISAWHIVMVQVSEWVVILIVYFIVFMRKAIFSEISSFRVGDFWNDPPVRKIVAGSMYVYAGFVLFVFYSKIDQLLLSWFLGAEMYGLYMMSARLIEASVVLIVSLNLFFYPKLVSAYSISFKRFSLMIRQVSFIFLFIAVGVIVVVWATRLTYDQFPSAFQGVVPYQLIELLSWMVFSVVPVFFFGLRSSFFTIIDRPENILFGSAFGLLSALFIGVPSMYFWGATGGAICILSVSFFSMFVSNFFTIAGRQYLKIVFPVG